MSTAVAGGGEDGNGDGDPKGENTNTAPDPNKMSTFERDMLHHLQGVTTDVIAERNLLEMLFMLHQICNIICIGKLQMPLQEERNLIEVVFMLHQQTCVLLIHQLKNVTKKDKPSSSHRKND
jgi:hypothetical protein